MGTLMMPAKREKTITGGAGVFGLGTVQLAAISTSGAALTLTSWAGREIIIHTSATVRVRWAKAASPTTISATDGADSASPVATGGGKVYADMPNYRDVPTIDSPASAEGVFLIVTPTSGTVDIIIEVVG